MRDDLIYGIHVIRSILEKDPKKISEIFFLETRNDPKINELLTLAKKNNIKIQSVPKKQLENWLPHIKHQGIVANLKHLSHMNDNFSNNKKNSFKLKFDGEKNDPLSPLGERARVRGTQSELFSEYDLPEIIQNTKKPPFLLILDCIQDPHNLGACLRTADAVGIDAVILPKDKSAPITPVVRKVASGAAETVPIVQVTNLARTIEMLKKENIWIIGTSMNAKQSLFQTDFKFPIALVLGAEGSGLRRLTEESCDILMHIPMLGSVESLNVSVAAAISMYEVFRQRNT